MAKTNKCVKEYVGKRGPKFKKLLRDLVKFSREHKIDPATSTLGYYQEGIGGKCCALGALGVMCKGAASYGYEVGSALFGEDYDKVHVGNDGYAHNSRAKNPFKVFGREFQRQLRSQRAE